MNTNLYGHINLTEALLDLIHPGCSVINMSSRYGSIKFQKFSFFLNFEEMTQEKFEQGLSDFKNSTINHSLERDCWLNGVPSDNIYSVSKAFLNPYTRMLDRKLKLEGVNIKVNCCHPGHCQTDMGGPNAPKSYLKKVKLQY